MERPLRVLIAEDEQDIARLIKLALERDGKIQVEIASTGDIALKTISAEEPVSDKSCLIWLDIGGGVPYTYLREYSIFMSG